MALIPHLPDLFAETRKLRLTQRKEIIEATAADWIREVRDEPYHLGLLALKIDVAVKRIMAGAYAHPANASSALIYVQAAGRMLGEIDMEFKRAFDACVVERVLGRMREVLDLGNDDERLVESPVCEAHWAFTRSLRCGRYIDKDLFEEMTLAYMKKYLASISSAPIFLVSKL